MLERLELAEHRLLRKYVLNDEDVAGNHPDLRFKIVPTLVDRDAFVHAMNNGVAVHGFEESLIVQAHEFFQLQIREWLGDDTQLATSRAHGLSTALVGLLQMVVIDLQMDDDANIIFETLNARGTPLLASDLIKNSALHDAQKGGWEQDEFYQRYWSEFDSAWWRRDIRQGRLVRPRLDVFANYWLAMKTGTEVLSKDVFPRYREYQASMPIDAVVRDMQANGVHYRAIEESSFPAWSSEDVFLYRWHTMDAGVSTPIVLWLFANAEVLGSERFHRALSVLESYLVRRMICRMTSKDYSRLFHEMMAAINESEPSRADEVILEVLASQSADSRLWPMDATVRTELQHLPLYRLLTRGRLRLVLEAIEDDLRGPKTEDSHAPRGQLTIEHIMPQEWGAHWPLPTERPEDLQTATVERDRLVHALGNLTLVTKSLNPAMSNGSWQVKRHGLDQHSVLRLNKRLLDGALDDWSENDIRSRTAWMSDAIVRIWPRPVAGLHDR